MKDGNFKTAKNLIRNVSTEKGLQDLFLSKHIFQNLLEDNVNVNFDVEFTLQRMELYAFITHKIEECAFRLDYQIAANLSILTDFIQREDLNFSFDKVYGLDVDVRNFRKHFLLFQNIISDFHKFEMLDKHNQINLNYEYRDLIMIIKLLKLCNLDEIKTSRIKNPLLSEDIINLVKQTKMYSVHTYNFIEDDHSDDLYSLLSKRTLDLVFRKIDLLIIETPFWDEERVFEILESDLISENTKISIRDSKDLTIRFNYFVQPEGTI